VSLGVDFPPFVYVFWVAYAIRKQKLLPRKGRTRALALYFSRIVIIFILFFTPMMIIAMYSLFVDSIASAEYYDSWLYFSLCVLFSLLTPIQTLVNVRFMLQKADIQEAIQSMSSSFTARFSVPKNGNWDVDDKHELSTTDKANSDRKCGMDQGTAAPRGTTEISEVELPAEDFANEGSRRSEKRTSRGSWLKRVSIVPKNDEWNMDDKYELSTVEDRESGMDPGTAKPQGTTEISKVEPQSEDFANEGSGRSEKRTSRGSWLKRTTMPATVDSPPATDDDVASIEEGA
jgi:hypothetical protein